MGGKSVAVIGAGVSGLCAVKTALEYGLNPICFEQKDDIGGLWDVLHPYPDHLEQDGRIYSGLHQNNCKPFYTFSDFPAFERHPYYLSADHVKEYLCAYADHFHLRPYIHCGRKVKSVKKAEDYRNTGRWTVTTVNSRTKDDEQTETYDAVYVCVGYFAKANIPPPYPGQDNFAGTIIHSAKYWNPQPYKNQTVMLVGGSISSGDIGTHLCAGGAKMCLKGAISSYREDGVKLTNGEEVKVDHVIYTTGYSHDFPFLDEKDLIPSKRSCILYTVVF